MERLKDQKADQKSSALAPLLETEVCSAFGFIEAALKCYSKVDMACNMRLSKPHPSTSAVSHPAHGSILNHGSLASILSEPDPPTPASRFLY